MKNGKNLILSSYQFKKYYNGLSVVKVGESKIVFHIFVKTIIRLWQNITPIICEKVFISSAFSQFSQYKMQNTALS